MALLTIWNTLVLTIQTIGYVQFGIIIIVDILLWRVHPVLGIIAALLTFSFLMHWI